MLLILIAKALVEVALLLLLGRTVLHVMLVASGPRRADNFVYRLFELGVRPILRLAGAILPRRLGARSVPLLAAALLLACWCLLVVAKWQACRLEPGAPACRPLAGQAR
jgi:hypothetical protein